MWKVEELKFANGTYESCERLYALQSATVRTFL